MREAGVVTTERTRIAYYETGSTNAPVLLMSNSLGTTSAMWNRTIPPLADHFRVIRYDQRGHGASSSPSGPYTIEDLGRDALDLLGALEVETTAICGLSLGGMVAMWVAANEPERVTRLVLASTSARLGPPEAWYERAAAVRSSGLHSIAGSSPERWFTTAFRSENPRAVAEVVSMLETCDVEGYASCCEAIAAMDQLEDLVNITASTIVIAGNEDPVTPLSVAAELSRTIPGASLKVVQNASHLVNLEQPELFEAALLAHLMGDAADRSESDASV